MKALQKKILCLGLLAVLTAPLAGCGSTWQGVKNDWHDMTGSSDSSDAASAQPQAQAQVQPAPVQAQPAATQPAQAQTAAPHPDDSGYSFNK